ncbi:DUF2178 domain-containing protein [Neobacillus sp. 19]|uniref:DUF2178 domain-containing protein n=1 Tax=Neobacillus sp. 19 TaxID=3394458 RepID=UPI003BF6CBBD
MDNLVGVSGLLLGVVITIIVHIVVNRVGAKKHMFDERQKFISTNARAMSWNVTTIVILAAWAVVIIIEGISLSFFIMTGIYVLHCSSLFLTSAYFANRN